MGRVRGVWGAWPQQPVCQTAALKTQSSEERMYRDEREGRGALLLTLSSCSSPRSGSTQSLGSLLGAHTSDSALCLPGPCFLKHLIHPFSWANSPLLREGPPTSCLFQKICFPFHLLNWKSSAPPRIVKPHLSYLLRNSPYSSLTSL